MLDGRCGKAFSRQLLVGHLTRYHRRLPATPEFVSGRDTSEASRHTGVNCGAVVFPEMRGYLTLAAFTA